MTFRDVLQSRKVTIGGKGNDSQIGNAKVFIMNVADVPVQGRITEIVTDGITVYEGFVADDFHDIDTVLIHRIDAAQRTISNVLGGKKSRNKSPLKEEL